MIVGIDPGIRGSMAFISSDKGLEIVRLPIRVEKRSKREMKFIDTPALYKILLAMRPRVAFVENVFSCPSDTPMTAFSFGNSKGRIETCLELLHLHPDYNHVDPSTETSTATDPSTPISIIPISASVWKNKMGCTTNKLTSRLAAEKLYPNFKFASIDDCEAALIATYGMLFSPI
jgi:hypothetical protein